MRKFTADLVFTGTEFKRSTIIVADEDGIIRDLVSADSVSSDDIEKHEGILAPGFINAHCHLELSHLKGVIEKHTGLDQFIRAIEQTRHATQEETEAACRLADKQMYENGIVATGDISNSSISFGVKKKSSIEYYTFAEVFGFHPSRSEQAFQKGADLCSLLKDAGLEGSITPHAPYSASVSLLKKIGEDAYVHGGPLTIHMEESSDEDLLFIKKEGKILERLRSFGIDDTHFSPTGFSALRSTLIHLPKCNRLQLVHNTYASPEDIKWAEEYHKLLYWCFCPKANLYIENRLPDLDMFYRAGVRCTIGTDSLASNNRLDILDEIKTIHSHYPALPVGWLITAATKNGAEYLGKTKLGTIEPGKKPGINLLTGIDVKANSISRNSKVARLL